MADIRIKDLPTNGSPSPSQFVATDLATTQKLTIQAMVDIGVPVASQAEAEAGVNATKRMTPLTTAQAIDVQAATFAQGALADTAVQPGDLSAVATTGNYNDLSNQPSLSADLIYPVKANAIAATIPSIENALRINGSVTEGDGLGGLYIDTNNGNPDTFVSSGGTSRTWYRAPDVGATRLVGAPDIRNFLDTAPYVATRTAAKALDTTKETTLILTEAGREGIFNWRAGDYSTQIAADTLEGIYIKATAIAATEGAWVRVYDGEADIRWFGAKGDGSTDDAPAIAVGLAVWKLLGCTLVFPDPLARYRMASGVLVDLSGKASVGKINMIGAIKPDAGIGAAITIRNSRGGDFTMRVFGGGQTADYTQADPVGCDEAFRFVNVYGSVLHYIEGQEYAGRVLRMTSDSGNLGPDGFRTQWVDIRSVYCNSSAKLTDIEATRMAKGVGQAFFIDSGLNAFGTIGLVYLLWELYGPVIENTSDITCKGMESLWRGNSGFELRGVLSFWGGKFNIGSELVSGAPDLLRVKDSSTRSSANIQIEQIFAIGGANGVLIENVGTVAGQGIKIGALFTRLNKVCGLKLVNTRKFEISHHSYADEVAIETSGACQEGDIYDNYTGSKKSSIIIGSGSDNIVFRGHCTNGNRDAAASTPLIDINTTGAVFFDKHFAGCDQSNFIYDFIASNITRLDGGRITIGGATAAFTGTPNRVLNVVGLVVANKGVATILSGGTSIVVNHGLAGTPSYVGLTARTVGSVDNYVDTIGATQFTIRVPSAVGADTPVLWEAALNYSV